MVGERDLSWHGNALPKLSSYHHQGFHKCAHVSAQLMNLHDICSRVYACLVSEVSQHFFVRHEIVSAEGMKWETAIAKLQL